MGAITEIKIFVRNETRYWSRRDAFSKCSYGDQNRHKKFRVLCNKEKLARAQGLISTISTLLPNMIEARRYGYIPVVDLCQNSHWQPMLQEQNFAKKENAWEYYFTQPNKDITLDEVWQSKYVERQIKSCRNPNYDMGDGCLQSNIRTRVLGKAIRQNIHLQPEIRNRVIHERHKLFPREGKILGVGIRAGYRAGILRNSFIHNGHPIVGSCASCIKGIEKKLLEWNYDSFFLAIDDRQYMEAIKKYFGHNCICLERPRVHYFKDSISDIPQVDDNEKGIEFDGVSVKEKNEDYLVELYLLAQCDGLFASRGTGHNFAFLLNNGKYSHVEFEDLGEFRYAR